MSNTAYKVIEHRSAWRSSELGKAYFTDLISAEHLDAFDAALESIGTKDVEAVVPDDFDLSPIAASLDAWRLEVMTGYGLKILSGFPVDRYSRGELARIHWMIGLHFGIPQSQSVMGDRLGHVVGVGGKDPKERAYRNSTELAMHTDACDVVGMFCLQTAREGGISGYVSAIAIYNEVLHRRPDLLPVLFRGFRYHRFGEEAPGESPVTDHRIPVFSSIDGYLSVNYLRAYIDLASQELGQSLSAPELEALDLMDQIAHDDSFALSFMTEPGEAVYFNNFTILHNRTAFEDSDVDDEKRHLLRLWLAAHNPRPKADAVDMYEGRGISPQEGRSTYLERDLDYREFSKSSR